MEGSAMFKQFIGQLQELLELSPQPPPVPLQRRLQLPQPPQSQLLQYFHNQDRWSFLNIADNPADDYHGLVAEAGKSGGLKMMEPYKPPPLKKSRKTRGKISGNTVMEQQIWKDFPEELFEAVIARLPVTTFFRFRSVCREWNSMLNSQTFSQHCAQVQPPNPWFYTITRENMNSGAMYDPSSKKWHHPAISCLPRNIIVLPVASSGGLVCFLDIGWKNLFVCNPLTQTYRELPPRLVKVWSRVVVGMTLNPKSTGGGYKILLVANDGCEVYDSMKNSWVCGSMPLSFKLPLNFRAQTVSLESTVYFMRWDPDGVVSYDMVTGVWKHFTIPAPPHITDHTLAECGGRIMLVGLVTKNAATCVCIWELQKMTLLWKEVDRMPNVWCLEFYGKHVRMTCLGNKGLLMLSLRSRQMNRLVTYDVSSREWVKVPGCTVPRGRKRQVVDCGTAFYPCLTAKA